MTSFSYFTGTEVDFGEGVLKKLPQKLQQMGLQKPCLVTDKAILEQSFAKQLLQELPNAVLYTGVVPNPTISSVNECAAFCRENACDGLIALGGGSAIDTVKAAAIVATTGKSVACYLDGKGTAREELPQNLMPFVAVPTTSGTGSEVSQYAVITDETTQRKDSISSCKMYPLYAVVDPTVTYQLPKNITVATGLDVLGHSLEAITSTIQNPMTDLLALEAIAKVFRYLPLAANGNTKEARQEMAFASMLAGVAMSHCCGTLPHGMGCPLSGHCGVPHGLAVGVLQIPTLRLVAQQSQTQLERIARYLDKGFHAKSPTDAADYLIDKIAALFIEIGRKPDLCDFHISHAQVEAMIQDAMAHGCTGLMPVAVDENTVRRIYIELAEGVH